MDMKQFKTKCKELSQQGVTIFSYSKLGSFKECPHQYHLTYHKKLEGKENIYSYAGSKVHETLEDIYHGKADRIAMESVLNDIISDIDILDLRFPNDKIKDKWIADMVHYAKNFQVIGGEEFIIEEPFIFEISDGIWLRGFIDNQKIDSDGRRYIIDWKTSSKFSGKKLKESGRQLVIYKMAKESEGGDIYKTGWGMLKYVNFCFTQKNGRIKKKMCNRSTWASECENYIVKFLDEEGYDEFDAHITVDELLESGNIDVLPEEVQKRFWLEDCYVWYDVMEKDEQEVVDYVTDICQSIASKDPEKEEDWPAKKIDNQSSFFCTFLCSHGGKTRNCEYYQRWLEDQSFQKDDDEDDDWLGL